jgi:hypothetical protein
MPIPGEPFSLSTTIYPGECVAVASAAYAEFCTVTVSTLSADEVTVTVGIAPTCASKAQTVLDEFLNYALDLSLRTHLGIGAQPRGL